MSVPIYVSTCGGDVTFIHFGYNEKLPLNHSSRTLVLVQQVLVEVTIGIFLVGEERLLVKNNRHQ